MARVINPANYVLGQNSALWLNKATVDEIKLMGLQGMGLGIGFTQTSQTISMMGQRISPKAFTGAEYDEMSVNANFIPGDTSQAILQAAALNSTLLKNVRMYLRDGCSFSAPDQIAAGGGLISGTSGLNVGSYSDPQIGSPSDLYTNTISFAPAGPFTVFVAHTPPGSGDLLTIGGTPGTTDMTITTTGDDWADMGFDLDDTVLVDWDGAGTEVPKYGKVSAISAKILTLELNSGDVNILTVGTLVAASAVHAATSQDVSGLNLTC